MSENYSIAIVGQKDIVMGFKALGLTSVNAHSTEQAVAALYRLKQMTMPVAGKEGAERPKYAVIFITEELAKDIHHEDYAKLSADALPAIIIIPGIQGSTGLGLKRLGKIVERAIGSNILKD